MIKPNPAGDYPEIHKSAYIDSTAVIIGKVKIGKNVFIGPLAVIRADEPKSRIIIKDNCNVQDRVIVHALRGTLVEVDKFNSLSHGCIVHGPCKIGKKCFIGFGSVIFNAKLGQGVVVKHLSVVEGVCILAGRLIEPCRLIKSVEDARKLEPVNQKTRDFVKKVLKTNLALVKGYIN